MKKLKKLYRSQRKVIWFGANLFLLLAVYYIFYTYLRYSPLVHSIYEFATAKLTQTYLQISKAILQIFSYQVHIYDICIRIVDDNGICLDRGCLGRNLKVAYIGLVLAFPISVKIKLKYLLLGLLCIFCANSIRVTALTYIHAFHRDYFQGTHNLIFKIFVYALTFLMWHLMFKEYSRKKKGVNKDKSK